MTTEIASFPATNQARSFAIIAAALFLNNTVALMLGPLLVDIADEFDISVAVAGQLAAATFFSWAIFAPLIGPFSDSFGRRLVALTGLGVMGVCMLAAAFAPNFIVLMFLLLLVVEKVFWVVRAHHLPPGGVLFVSRCRS